MSSPCAESKRKVAANKLLLVRKYYRIAGFVLECLEIGRLEDGYWRVVF
jgi:hypothetical protein